MKRPTLHGLHPVALAAPPLDIASGTNKRAIARLGRLPGDPSARPALKEALEDVRSAEVTGEVACACLLLLCVVARWDEDDLSPHGRLCRHRPSRPVRSKHTGKRVMARGILLEQDFVEKSDERAEGGRTSVDGWSGRGCGRWFIVAVALAGGIFYVERVGTYETIVRIFVRSLGLQESERLSVMQQSTVQHGLDPVLFRSAHPSKRKGNCAHIE